MANVSKQWRTAQAAEAHKLAVERMTDALRNEIRALPREAAQAFLEQIVMLAHYSHLPDAKAGIYFDRIRTLGIVDENGAMPEKTKCVLDECIQYASGSGYQVGPAMKTFPCANGDFVVEAPGYQ